MLGTVVNTISIIAGSFVGLFLKGGIPERFNKTIMDGLALCILLIGAADALKVNNLLLVIFSLVIGAVLGEAIDIDRRLKSLGDNIEVKLKGRGGRVSDGFVNASLLFCVGAMAIVGSLESGMSGNYKTLFAKSTLDGITSIMISSSMGIGVMFSAASVFVYQGAITIAASLLKGLLVGSVIADMTAAGGLLIIGIALNMLGVTKIRLANLLPAIFIPVVYQAVMSLF